MHQLKYYLFLIPIFISFFSKGNIYQAETALLFKAVTETKNSGYSGESYINFDNETGSYLELKVGMKQAGEQTVKIRYAHGATGNRPIKIELNNVVVIESLVFEPTGSWTNWDTVSINIVFEEGVNILKCTSAGNDGGPNIDLFDVSGEQAQTFSLNLSVDGNGQVTRSPETGLLFEGEEITLIAKPNYNSVFRNWSGDFSSEKDTLKFILDADKTVQANFIEIEIYLPEPDFSMLGYATVSGEGIETTTGGVNGNTVIIETLAQLISWGASREDNYTAETVIIKGKIEASETTVITIKRGKDISILGESNSNGGYAELKNISLNIRDYSNVIVRNLKMHEVFYPNDDLTIDECHHVWIDHCEFHSKVGDGIGYDTYDGLLDIKKGSHNVTVSWCYFHDHMKTVLIGHSDNNGEQDANLEITFHHNWFSNTDGRNPSLRFGKVHYYNNFLENITDYGFAVRNGAHAKIENCHFENVKLPIASDKFSGHGFACVSGCIYSGSTSEADNKINESVDCEFWDTQIPYEYILEDVNSVNLSVREYAGVGKINTATSAFQIKQGSNLKINHYYFDKNEEKIKVSFFLKNTDKLTFSLYDIQGRKLLNQSQSFQSGNNQVQLHQNNVKQGFYFFCIEGSDERISRKIVL